MPFCVGLTGGIGSGKSAAAEMFKALGAAVVDTDEISRSLTARGAPRCAPIREQFGPEYIAADGSLDRERMRRLVFGNAAAKQQAGGDPASDDPRGIARRAWPQRQRPTSSWWCRCCWRPEPISISCSACWWWTAARNEQIARAIAPQRAAADEVRAIMAAQLPRASACGRADDVLAQ